jgi:hypothetical protein
MVLWVWVAVTATHHTIFNPSVQGRLGNLLGVRGSFGALSGFENLPKLALAIAGYAEELPRQLNGLLLRVRLENGETGDQLLGLSEWPIGDG